MVTSPQGLNVELLHTSIAICSLLLPLFFVACTGTGLWGALKVQSSNSNTKTSRGQVHTLRGHGVRLTCQSMHFHSSKYQNLL